jgi:antitoxin MazE
MQVSKWGNSLAVRLPRAVVEALKLKEGDEIEVVVAGTHRFEVSRDRTREEALKKLRKYRGRLPEGFKFDRDEANARR